jgi:hypothetical protein
VNDLTEALDAGTATRLNALEWHDSLLWSLTYDRRDASRDELRLHLRIITDQRQWLSEEVALTLQECRLVRMELRGGVICLSDGEMIDEAHVSTSDPLIEEARRWPPTQAPLALLQIRLASTGSSISAVFERAVLVRKAGGQSHPAPVRMAPGGPGGSA